MSAIQAVAAMRTMPGANGQSARAMPQDSISEFHGSMPGTSADATSAVRTTMEERLFQSSANFKILTSMVAMHLPVEWREKMFQQIDTLLDAEQWESDDAPPTVFSARTFLRLILALNSSVRPGLGASHDGNLIAAWTKGKNRLTVECLGGDRLKWSVVREAPDRESVDRIVGATGLGRFVSQLAPYRPEIWFTSGEQ